jgi:glutamate synthase (NADPH/NADH) large chain
MRRRFVGRHDTSSTSSASWQRYPEQLQKWDSGPLDEVTAGPTCSNANIIRSCQDRKIDLAKIIYFPKEANLLPIRRTTTQHHKIDDVLDRMLISEALPAIEHQQSVGIKAAIKNTDRAVGAMLSGTIAARYGQKGLPEHTISAYFEGSAQSFGAFWQRVTSPSW